MMSPRDRVTDDLTLVGDRGDERYVRQVGPAGVGVVYGEDVARLGLAVHYGRDGLWHRAEVDRDVLGLGDHAALRVEERRRAVASLLDIRGVGAPDQDGTHLLGDPRQGAGENRECYRIKPTHRLFPARACLHHLPHPATLALRRKWTP